MSAGRLLRPRGAPEPGSCGRPPAPVSQKLPHALSRRARRQVRGGLSPFRMLRRRTSARVKAVTGSRAAGHAMRGRCPRPPKRRGPAAQGRSTVSVLRPDTRSGGRRKCRGAVTSPPVSPGPARLAGHVGHRIPLRYTLASNGSLRRASAREVRAQPWRPSQKRSASAGGDQWRRKCTDRDVERLRKRRRPSAPPPASTPPAKSRQRSRRCASATEAPMNENIPGQPT